LLASCDKDEDSPTLAISVLQFVDDDIAMFDTLIYENAAGNEYSITKLHYYLSNFRFVKPDGSEVGASSDVKYFDGEAPTTLSLKDVPEGSFTGLRFHVGVPADQNVLGGLTNTTENINMIWPVPMGGGYHFLKFEGHFRTAQGPTNGFAIHIGSDTCLVNVSIETPFEVTGSGEMELGFNLNQIMAEPNTFNMDSANYTMGITPAMYEVSTNMSNAFTIETTP